MEKNNPISEPLAALPDHCQFVDIHTIICSIGDNDAELCEIIEGNELLCGPENKECEIYEGAIGCKEKMEIVDPINGRPMKDVFIGHAYLVVIAAILSLALTQIIKPFIFKTCNEKSDAIIRLFAVLTGAFIAYSLSKPPVQMIDVYMGASAGAINAFVIKMFKAKVKKSLGVDETPEPKKDDSNA